MRLKPRAGYAGLPNHQRAILTEVPPKPAPERVGSARPIGVNEV
jgi:hypothetical protein